MMMDLLPLRVGLTPKTCRTCRYSSKDGCGLTGEQIKNDGCCDLWKRSVTIRRKLRRVVKSNLLPCPFCGKNVLLTVATEPQYIKLVDMHFPAMYVINCFDCSVSLLNLSMSKAERLWNRRASPPRIILSKA